MYLSKYLRFWALFILATGSLGSAWGDWKPHVVRQLGGRDGEIRIPAKLQIVTEKWNRVVAVPYIVFMPERQRVLMLVGCDYPHQAMVLHSDDHGNSWSGPKCIHLDSRDKCEASFALALTYLGKGKVIALDSGDQAPRWLSQDYGATWSTLSRIERTPDGMPWHVWDPLWVDRDPTNGKVTQLVETGYTWFRPPAVKHAHQQGYIRFSSDGGKTFSKGIKVPQWKEVSEVALLRAADGNLIGACRTDMPKRFEGDIDHYEGLGISISKDNGRTWSEINRLYTWGRHHPSMLLMPNGHIVMTYVVRKGYVNAANGNPQFGIEAIVSTDNGRGWDLDHRYILHAWEGDKNEKHLWQRGSQATSSALLDDGTILTAFGTGYRSHLGADNLSAPRDVGLVKWRPADRPLNTDRTLRDARFDSELRNLVDPKIDKQLPASK